MRKDYNIDMKIGIVGLPNVGKSTLFKALTKKQVLIENYPFATIEPNVGVVAVPDDRLAPLAEISKSKKIVPATIEFVDIAGLVAGAHKGEGLGNKFLHHIREVDAIVEVVRDFEDDNIVHVAGRPDPERDHEVINLELIMADLETVMRRWDEMNRRAKTGDKTAIMEAALYERIKKTLDAGTPARQLDFADDKKKIVKQLNLLTMKPLLLVYNVAENDPRLKTDKGLAISAKIEAELADLEACEAVAYLKELGFQCSGLDRLIKKSYELLKLITYLTSGEIETKAWTIHRGTLAPEAAGVIHTDFEKGFIAAEIIPWREFVESHGWTMAKEKGLVRLEGKNYVIQDGDVVFFRFAPT